MPKYLNSRHIICIGIILAFLANSFGPLPNALADEFVLPAPGRMVALSPDFSPAVLKGIQLDPQNPFKFHFFVDRGDKNLNQEELKRESARLIKYFLASLTIPEKDRIVPQEFGQTEMGRDLLAEDYLLKQITASLIYPESQLGKEFWAKVYAQAQAKYGTTNIPINTFNKVWIVPERAVVYENGGTAFVLENHLKVMLEQDYLSLKKHTSLSNPDVNALGSQVVREIVIPALTKEVNEGKNFSQLRQVFYSLILATWYKKKIKDSILNKVYSNRNKISGVQYDHSVIADSRNAVISERTINDVEAIYQSYLKAFKKGVYNYIKDADAPNGASVPRKYFSGGVTAFYSNAIVYKSFAQITQPDIIALGSKLVNVTGDFAMTTKAESYDELNALTEKVRSIKRMINEDVHGIKGCFAINGMLMYHLQDEPQTEIAMAYNSLVGPIKQYFLILKAPSGRLYILDAAPEYHRQPPNFDVVVVPLESAGKISKLYEGYAMADRTLLDQVGRYLHVALNVRKLEFHPQARSKPEIHNTMNAPPPSLAMTEEAARLIVSNIRIVLGNLSIEIGRRPNGDNFDDLLDQLHRVDEAFLMVAPHHHLRRLAATTVFRLEQSIAEKTEGNDSTLPSSGLTGEFLPFKEHNFYNTTRIISSDPNLFKTQSDIFYALRHFIVPYLRDHNNDLEATFNDPRFQLRVDISILLAKHGVTWKVLVRNLRFLFNSGAESPLLMIEHADIMRNVLRVLGKKNQNGFTFKDVVEMYEEFCKRSKMAMTPERAEFIAARMLNFIADTNPSSLRFEDPAMLTDVFFRSYVNPLEVENMSGSLMFVELKDIDEESRTAFCRLSNLTLQSDERYILVATKDAKAVLIGRLTKKEHGVSLDFLPIDQDLAIYETVKTALEDKFKMPVYPHRLDTHGIVFKAAGSGNQRLVTLGLRAPTMSTKPMTDEEARDIVANIDRELGLLHKQIILRKPIEGYVDLFERLQRISNALIRVGLQPDDDKIKAEINGLWQEMARIQQKFGNSRSGEMMTGEEGYKKLLTWMYFSTYPILSLGKKYFKIGKMGKLKEYFEEGSLEIDPLTGIIYQNKKDEILDLNLIETDVPSGYALHDGKLHDGDASDAAMNGLKTLDEKRTIQDEQYLKKVKLGVLSFLGIQTVAILVMLYVNRNNSIHITNSPEPSTPTNGLAVPAKGGIDLNPAQMSMKVKKEGEDFKFDFNGTEIDAAQVTGATFIIRQMTPVTNLPQILGLNHVLNDGPKQAVLAKA